MTTLQAAQVIAHAVVRIVSVGWRTVLLWKYEEGGGYKLVVVQGRSVMERFFDSLPDAFPDAFARFLDYANATPARRGGRVVMEFPEGAWVKIYEQPPLEELLAAWERIGGRVG
jgi:hypothetical protein